jgi:hypothetical protein
LTEWRFETKRLFHECVDQLGLFTYYDMPADVCEGDDPYEFLLGKENAIPND